MSRVGKKPIEIPSGVDVKFENNHINVKGPKGELARDVHPLVSVAIEDVDGAEQVVLTIDDLNDKQKKAQWGTARANIANMVHGVTEEFEKKLEVNGVGYRVNLQGREVVLNVGFSHEVRFALPEGVDAVIEGNLITLSGIDRQLVGEVAANIRKVKKPEPYKGKGIKYVDEVIRRKAGKAQKSAE